jgi:hypothetical protein
VRATLAGGADPIQVVSCAHALIDSVIGHCRRLPDPAPPLGALSRYLAWLANTALLMSVRGVAGSRAARELAALTTDARLKILRCVDPDPKSAAHHDELGSILTSPLQVLLWTGDFTEFHGAHQASALYGTYEILTGTKFMGNYWDGASILTQLRQSLYGDQGRVSTPEADAARRALGSVEGYDHFWALVSVTVLATLRDARLPHPPELIRPEALRFTRQTASVVDRPDTPRRTEDFKEQLTVSGPHAEDRVPTPLPLRTVGDIRAALQSGRGFPNDQVCFEADLHRALEASSEMDLSAVARVIVDYRGRIRLCQEPDFDTAVYEGIELTGRLKRQPGEW